MDSSAPLSMILVPFVVLGIKWLASFITGRMKDGKLKSLLLRRIGSE